MCRLEPKVQWVSDLTFQLTSAEHISGLIVSFISVSQMSVHCELT